MLFSRRPVLTPSARCISQRRTQASRLGNGSSHMHSNVPHTPEKTRRGGLISTIRSEPQKESSLGRKKGKPESGQKGKLFPRTLIFKMGVLGPWAKPQQPPMVVSGTRPHQPAGRSRQAHKFQESHLKKDESQTLNQPGTRTSNCCVRTEPALMSGLRAVGLGNTPAGGHGPSLFFWPW